MPIWDSPLTPAEFYAKQKVLKRWIPIHNWCEDRGLMRLAAFIDKHTMAKLPYG